MSYSVVAGKLVKDRKAVPFVVKVGPPPPPMMPSDKAIVWGEGPCGRRYSVETADSGRVRLRCFDEEGEEIAGGSYESGDEGVDDAMDAGMSYIMKGMHFGP
jgi:hypothetical protein